MKIKDIKKELENYDENAEIVFCAFDEYGCEIENVKFKEIKKSGWSETIYIAVSAEN